MLRSLYFRMRAVHYIGIVLLLINAFVFTQNTIASAIQVVIAIVIFIHEADETANGIKLSQKLAQYLEHIDDSDAQMKREDFDTSFSSEYDKILKIIEERDVKKSKYDEANHAFVDEVIEVASSVKRGNLNRQITSDAPSRNLTKLKNIFNEMLHALDENTVSVIDVLSQYKNNNFMNTVDKKEFEGDLEKLADGVNTLGLAISGILAENKRNGLILAQDSQLLATNVEKLKRSANNQVLSIEETANNIERIAKSIDETTAKTRTMSQVSKQTQDSANSEKDLASKTADAMNEVGSSTSAILEAIVVIDQISFQTNILSLNAAVEAATAGESGKGFAVVAQEVRNLAGRSAEAANEIKSLVETATNKTKEGQVITDDMISGYARLIEAIFQNTELIEEIASDSKAQLDDINHINSSIQQFEQSINENVKIADDTEHIAIQANQISKKIVDSADEKVFTGKDNATIRKNITDKNFQGKERRKIEKAMKEA